MILVMADGNVSVGRLGHIAALAKDEQHLFSQIAAHAKEDHGMLEIPAALITQVRGFIQDVNVGF